IEPTETEAKETLDAFVAAMLRIVREAADDPKVIKEAPHDRPVRRLDEVRAAKNPIVRYGFEQHHHPHGAGERQLEAQKGAYDRIEPTETEAKETLDAFVAAMLRIVREAADDPKVIKEAPHDRPVRRLDEVRAAKNPIVRYGFEQHHHPHGAGERQLEAQKGA